VSFSGIVVVPKNGEAVDGYLDRSSEILRLPVNTLIWKFPQASTHSGPSPCLMPEIDGPRLQRATGLTVDEFSGMYLAGAYPAHYGQLRGITPEALPRAAKDRWFFIAGSRYCPQCLASDSVWQVAWRLPWTVTCRKHRTLLSDTCPGCRHRPRSRRDETSTALYHNARIRNPNHCYNPARDPGLGRHAPACEHDLSAAPSEPVDPASVRLQSILDEILAGNPASVCGIDMTASEALQSWRELLVVDYHLAHPRGEKTRPWYSPPRSSALTLRALLRVQPIADANDVRTAGQRLRERFNRGDIDNNWFRDRLPQSPILARVYATALADHGRVSTQLRRKGPKGGRQPPLAMYNYTGANVPQRIPQAWLPQLLRERRGKPSPPMLQAVIALGVARLVEGDWTDAARALGFPAQKGRSWARYVICTLSAEEKQAYTDTVLHVAEALSRAERPIDRGAVRAPVASALDLARIPTSGLVFPS